MNKFKRFAWFLVFYALIVILWGAWVRISHSGDGCGASWPFCDGEAIPSNLDLKKFTEFFHRLKSGLFGLLVVALFLWSRRVFVKGHLVRRFALLSLLFTLSEALLGAVLVKAGLVASNDSPLRAFVMSAHLINSLALVGFLTLTAEFAKKKDWQKLAAMPWTYSKFSRKKWLIGSLGSFFLLGVTGAIAALATTLFPSESLLAGFMADIDPNAHYLLRLRGAHPLLGMGIGILFSSISYLAYLESAENSEFQRRSLMMAMTTIAAVIVGALTLLSLSPVYLKLIHLTMTYSLWIILIRWLRTWRWA